MTLKRSSRAALVAAALTLGGVLPAGASAQPWEQVSVTSGAYTSATPADGFAVPNAVGDVGRFVGFRASFQNGQSGAFIRDIQNNVTSQPGGSAAYEIFGIDRAETKALVLRNRGTYADVVATPLVGGGTSKVLYTSGAATYASQLSGALSGDGSTALIADEKAGKVVKVAVATGATTYVQESAPWGSVDTWVVGDQALSDDGSVFALRRYTWIDDKNSSRVYRAGQPRLDVNGLASVSADGSTISLKDETRTTPFWTLRVRKLATGAEKSVSSTEGYDPWISADGNRVIFGREESPRQFDWATGAHAPLTGRFATFGGVRSASGRFQLGRAAGQLYVFDTTNTHIIGANDPPSGDQYVTAYSSNWCAASPYNPWVSPSKRHGTIFATLRATAVPFAAKAVSANVTLSVDITTLKSAALVPGQEVTADWRGNTTYGFVRGTVTDELGRTIPVARRIDLSAEYCG